MRTSRLASRPRKLRRTQIALCGFHDRQLSSGVDEKRASGLANFNHTDGLVGATVCAHCTAYARAIINSHGASIEIPGDRTARAADHTHWIYAVHASIGDHDVIVRPALTDKTRVIVVCCGTSPHAVVAPRAAIEIYEHGLGAVEEPVVGQKI